MQTQIGNLNKNPAMHWGYHKISAADSVKKSEKEEALKRPGTRDYGNNVNPDHADTGQEEYTDDDANKKNLEGGDKSTNNSERGEISGDDEIGRQRQKQEKVGSAYNGEDNRPGQEDG